MYEGGRSVLPDYMRQLGMDVFLVGAVLGIAEFAGWAVRPLGGYIADRTGRFSSVVRLGYGGLLVIPLMGVVPVWWGVAGLAFLERVFKGLRAPSRDAMLARLRGNIGLGTTFGLHELMDQVGAVLGPLLAVFILTAFNTTSHVFLFLAIPYAALIITLTRIPEYREPMASSSKLKPSSSIGIYSVSAGLNAAGLLPLPIVLYMISVVEGGGSWIVPAAYALAMVVDAAAGMVLGRAFDRWGPKVVLSAMAVSVLAPFFIYSPVNFLLISSLLVGIVIGAQESIFRAVVARLSPVGGLGSAYAFYGFGLGTGGAVSGVVFGYLLQTNAPLYAILLYSFVAQAAAAILLIWALKSNG